MIGASGLVVELGGHRVLRGVDLVARTGRVTGVVGPNGSGKSTLVRCLVGAYRPHGGTVALDGTDLRRRSRRWVSERIAFVGQHVDADPSLRVSDEVALGALSARVRGAAETDRRVIAALDAVSLLRHARRRVADLSGGELQRVSLARAIAHRASHAVLDEPTNHLDIHHRLAIGALLRRVAPTVIVVLHDLELAAQVCDDVIVLDDGAVAASGASRSVLTPAVIDPLYGVRTLELATGEGDTALAFRRS